MDKIKWSDEFITEVKEIDDQHKEIIENVNALYQVIEENKDQETIFRIIKSLDFYTTLHFETEEKYMKKYDFGDYENHEKAHIFFRNTYEQIRYNYHYIGDKNSSKHKLSHILAIHLSQILVDWLNLHFQTFDKEFAAFMKEKVKKPD